MKIVKMLLKINKENKIVILGKIELLTLDLKLLKVLATKYGLLYPIQLN